jgi:hypothetical protein
MTWVGEKDWSYSKAQWREKFSLLPRRCDISQQWLWGKHYCGTVVITGPGDPVIYNIWNHRDEHLIYKLKGKLYD